MPIKLPSIRLVIRIIQGIINFIVPLVCSWYESQALKEVHSQHDSVCIQAREISPHARIFQLLISIVIIPDIVFALTVITDLNNVARPFGLFYHACAAGICELASRQLKVGITYCGNPSQDTYQLAVEMAHTAAIIHAAYLIIVWWQLPPAEICHIPWTYVKESPEWT